VDNRNQKEGREDRLKGGKGEPLWALIQQSRAESAAKEENYRQNQNTNDEKPKKCNGRDFRTQSEPHLLPPSKGGCRWAR